MKRLALMLLLLGGTDETGEFVVIKDQLEGGTIPMALGSWKRMTSSPDQAVWW